MAEYNTLRAEILQKSTSIFQINGFAISAAAAILVIVIAAGHYYTAIIGALIVPIFMVPIWLVFREEFDSPYTN